MTAAIASWEEMTEGLTQHLTEAMRRGYVAAYRLLGDRELARDACQEAALKAVRAEHRYDPAQPFYPWFYRILKNHCLDRLRRRKPTAVGLHDDPVDAAQRGADDLVMADERSSAVQRAISALPDDLRPLIELRHFQDASYDEMAIILDIPRGTVMSRLYRARKLLRDKLKRDPAVFGARARAISATDRRSEGTP